jgi:hypothetical protein
MMEMDKDVLKSLFLETLQEHHESVIDAHAAHHEWIQERIESEQARKLMMSKITDAAIQWSVVGVLGYIGYWFQGHFKL